MINEVEGMIWDDLKLRSLTNTDDITQLKKKSGIIDESN